MVAQSCFEAIPEGKHLDYSPYMTSISHGSIASFDGEALDNDSGGIELERSSLERSYPFTVCDRTHVHYVAVKLERRCCRVQAAANPFCFPFGNKEIPD